MIRAPVEEDGGMWFGIIDAKKVAAFQKLADDNGKIRMDKLGYIIEGSS